MMVWELNKSRYVDLCPVVTVIELIVFSFNPLSCRASPLTSQIVWRQTSKKKSRAQWGALRLNGLIKFPYDMDSSYQTKVFYFLPLDFARLPDHHIYLHRLWWTWSSICLCTGNSFKQVHISCSYLEFMQYEYNVSKYFAI